MNMVRFVAVALCVFLTFSLQFREAFSQDSNTVSASTSGIDNDRIFQDLVGDDDYNDDDPFAGGSSESTSGGSFDTSDNKDSSAKDLQTILSLASSAVDWLKLYLQDAYDQTQNRTVCMQDVARLVDNSLSGQKWTIPFVDSAGKPGPSVSLGWLNFVGNLDQCEDGISPLAAATETETETENQTPRYFKGQYCVFTFSLVANPIAKPKFGICVPDSCPDAELTKHSSSILKQYKADENITLIHVECLKNETEVSAATVISFIILAIVGCLVILGTAFDIIYLQKKDDSAKNGYGKSTESNSINFKAKSLSYDTIASSQTNEVSNNTHPTQSEPNSSVHKVVSNVLLAFSVYTNGKKVLFTTQAPDSLKVLNGIRYLSIAWVILGHLYMIGSLHNINMATEADKYYDRWTYMVVSNSFSSVDTFLAMSGLLTSFTIINQMKNKESWRINWVAYYLHRFWRLTPPYMAILLLALGLTQYFGSGSMWGNKQPFDKEHCEDYWWKNLLYINNFNDELFGSCMPHSWYLANDMQFFILSPLMTVPLFLNPVAGLACCGVILLISWIVTGVLSSENDWVTLPLARYHDASDVKDWMNDYYTKPWNRIGPYVIGVFAGYILTIIKGKSLHVKWYVVLAGWTLATICGLAIIYGLYGDFSGDNESSTEVEAFYNAVSRTVWGAVVCWVILACDAGYGGPVNAFLSWKPFVVLGRLTYMIYLVHFYLLLIFYQNIGLPFFMNNTTMAVFFTGLLAISTAVAFVLMLFFESPMIGLEKIFARKRREKDEQSF